MSKKEILVIDDEQMILDMLDQILSAAGYDVQTALGGKKANPKNERRKKNEKERFYPN